MSNKIINLVYENESGNLNLTENSIMAALADISADDGTSVFPSYDTIAKKVKCSRSTAIRTITALCKKDYLLKKPRWINSKQTSNNYYINVKKLWDEANKDAPPLPEENVFEDQSRGSTAPPQGSQRETPLVAERYPNPPLTPTLSKAKENTKRKSKPKEEPLPLVAESVSDLDKIKLVFAHWRLTLNHRGAVLDAKRKGLIKRALESYTVDQLKQAIDGCASSSWHMGQNDKGTIYDALGLILRDSEHIEDFIRKATVKVIPTKSKKDQAEEHSANIYIALNEIRNEYSNPGNTEVPRGLIQ